MIIYVLTLSKHIFLCYYLNKIKLLTLKKLNSFNHLHFEWFYYYCGVKNLVELFLGKGNFEAYLRYV